MAEQTPHADEVRAIVERYDRRRDPARSSLYDPLDPYVVCSRQERERKLIELLRREAPRPARELRVLEVGCGAGSNLIDLIRLGFLPGNLVGNDLLEDRLAAARERLPAAVTLVPGDAASIRLDDEAFDIVLQSTVFTSILDPSFQSRLAARIWSLLRPGGGVLWYDFTWDNPRNPDVRGVPVRRLRALFPEGVLTLRRLTLAPPIGRRACRISPALYPLLNALPLLRTHVLAWVRKLA